MLSISTDSFSATSCGRSRREVIDLLLLCAAMCPAEALFEVLVITSEHCEIVHDVLYAGHCLHRELAHAVMVGTW